MATDNIIPKVDGAGSVLPKANPVTPRPMANREYEEFVIVGQPASEKPTEDEALDGGVAVYTFEQSPDIPTHIGDTCIGWCSDYIYAKWPSNKNDWKKLADCSALGGGTHVIETKIYCPSGELSPVVSGDTSYNAVFFRNVMMTRVLTQDNTSINQYPDNVVDPPAECIAENNGKLWAVIRYAGKRNDVPVLHLLVKEVQGTLNSTGYIPAEAEIIVTPFIGSERGDGFYDWSSVSDEMLTCKEFIGGEAAATILDYICKPDGGSSLGYCGTLLGKNPSCWCGTNTWALNSYTNDSAEDYVPVIPGMIVNPWPNQKCTCESGLYISYVKDSNGGYTPKTASLDLVPYTTYKTLYSVDVTADDLSLEARSTYEPCESGGLWCRYFGGSSDIWDKVGGKNAMMQYSQDAVRDCVFDSRGMDKWRVGVYVDNKGEIIAVKTGVVLGEEVTLNSGTWDDIVESRTHQSFLTCGAADEDNPEYIAIFGSGEYFLIAGYQGNNYNGPSTEFMTCVSYTRKLQFGEIGMTVDKGYCGTQPITLAQRVTIKTGEKGVAQSEISKINTVGLYYGDNEATIPNPPSFLSFPNGATGTNITATVDLDALFEKDDEGNYAPDQCCTFSVAVTVAQSTCDIENGVYYPDPSKRSTATTWVPFATMSGLGYQY